MQSAGTSSGRKSAQRDSRPLSFNRAIVLEPSRLQYNQHPPLGIIYTVILFDHGCPLVAPCFPCPALLPSLSLFNMLFGLIWAPARVSHIFSETTPKKLVLNLIVALFVYDPSWHCSSLSRRWVR
jgi:hypothetical protein